MDGLTFATLNKKIAFIRIRGLLTLDLFFNDIGEWKHSKVNKRILLNLCKIGAFSSLYEIKTLDPTIKTKCFNFNNINVLKSFLEPADIVLVAVPGHLGYNLLKTIIGLKKNIVDISFSPEDLLSLDKMAKNNDVTVVFDAGLAPGIPNFLLGNINKKENVKNFKYFVGGLPIEPIPPYNYKAPFSPIDVIEEYTRPARIMRNGKLITLPALSEIVEIEYNDVGKLEAFNSDGLRSILTTMSHIPNMLEKTLRYPGHADLIKRQFKSKKIQPGNEKSLEKLFEEWKLNPREKEFTVLDVHIECESESHNYFLYDETEKSTSISSMARTTGYTATATVNYLLERGYGKNGIFPPEIISNDTDIWTYINKYLSSRNIQISEAVVNK